MMWFLTDGSTQLDLDRLTKVEDFEDRTQLYRSLDHVYAFAGRNPTGWDYGYGHKHQYRFRLTNVSSADADQLHDWWATNTILSLTNSLTSEVYSCTIAQPKSPRGAHMAPYGGQYWHHRKGSFEGAGEHVCNILLKEF